MSPSNTCPVTMILVVFFSQKKKKNQQPKTKPNSFFLTKANEILRKAQGAVRLKVRKCGVPDKTSKALIPQDSIKLNNTMGGFFCFFLFVSRGWALLAFLHT